MCELYHPPGEIHTYPRKYLLSVAASDSHCQIKMDGKGLVECEVDVHRVARKRTLLLAYVE